MFSRRAVMSATIAGTVLAGLAAPAGAQDWKAKYPELVLAVIPAENASGTTERYTPLAAYLSKELGAKVTLRVAADYAGVIEGMKSGQIHIGYFGPSSYARAHTVSGGNVVAFVQETRKDGSRGYNSVLYVKTDAPYRTVADLKGKKVGLVDPNSTSGTMAPTFFMEKDGNPIAKHFAESVMTGSHENAVLALGNGQVDAAFNWWNSDKDSNLTRMANKGVVKAEDFRVVWKSPLLASSPFAYLNDMPADLKAGLQKAYLEMHTKDQAAFDKMSDGKDGPFAAATHKDYEDTVALNKFVDELRKKKE
jgi:phosphonate transport system substrate-binding protein